MEKELIDQFVRRFAYGKEVKQIDFLGAHSGSPFYAYCQECGVPTETFPEQPLIEPLKTCSQCAFLFEKKILGKAKSVAKEFFCCE
jgi:hypothetical protein